MKKKWKNKNKKKGKRGNRNSSAESVPFPIDRFVSRGRVNSTPAKILSTASRRRVFTANQIAFYLKFDIVSRLRSPEAETFPIHSVFRRTSSEIFESTVLLIISTPSCKRDAVTFWRLLGGNGRGARGWPREKTIIFEKTLIRYTYIYILMTNERRSLDGKRVEEKANMLFFCRRKVDGMRFKESRNPRLRYFHRK